MEVRRRRMKSQDTKHGAHVENDANTTISQSRNQRDEVSYSKPGDFLGVKNLECDYVKKKIMIRKYSYGIFILSDRLRMCACKSANS